MSKLKKYLTTKEREKYDKIKKDCGEDKANNLAKKHIIKKNRLATMYQPVKTMEDVNDLHSIMIQGNYPASMTSCEVCGINGNCGLECPALIDGECYNDEMNEEYNRRSNEQ